MMYPGSIWTRLGKFNFWVFRREAAEFLLLFVTIFGYDEAFLGCCGLRRTSLNFTAECFYITAIAGGSIVFCMFNVILELAASTIPLSPPVPKITNEYAASLT